MKRTLIALVAAGFAFAAGSSFAQTPAASPAKSAKHHSHKASHAKVAKKSTGTHVAKKKSKTPAAA